MERDPTEANDLTWRGPTTIVGSWWCRIGIAIIRGRHAIGTRRRHVRRRRRHVCWRISAITSIGRRIHHTRMMMPRGWHAVGRRRAVGAFFVIVSLRRRRVRVRRILLIRRIRRVRVATICSCFLGGWFHKRRSRRWCLCFFIIRAFFRLFLFFDDGSFFLIIVSLFGLFGRVIVGILCRRVLFFLLLLGMVNSHSHCFVSQ